MSYHFLVILSEAEDLLFDQPESKSFAFGSA
jgi:hypothetical protein